MVPGTRPTATIQYAENPPKKYQDIYPIDFEQRRPGASCWQAPGATSSCFWIERGVRIFRVDNPHTKPFPFWEWLIADVQREHPDVIFLSEAFTRPKMMQQLAKIGFSQSYTYFTWRETRDELQRVLDRAHPDADARVLPAEPLAQHARHPDRTTCRSAAGRCS